MNRRELLRGFGVLVGASLASDWLEEESTDVELDLRLGRRLAWFEVNQRAFVFHAGMALLAGASLDELGSREWECTLEREDSIAAENRDARTLHETAGPSGLGPLVRLSNVTAYLDDGGRCKVLDADDVTFSTSDLAGGGILTGALISSHGLPVACLRQGFPFMAARLADVSIHWHSTGILRVLP